jgi:hypothetical protein
MRCPKWTDLIWAETKPEMPTRFEKRRRGRGVGDEPSDIDTASVDIDPYHNDRNRNPPQDEPAGESPVASDPGRAGRTGPGGP